MARPKAEDLKHRCVATSQTTGERCGSPAAKGFTLCPSHMGPKDRKLEQTTAQRLVRLTVKALDALEDVISTGPPDARVRAAKLVLDRTAPASSSVTLNAITVNTGQPSGSDLIAERLAALRTMTEIEGGQVHGGLEEESTDNVSGLSPVADPVAGVIPPEDPPSSSLGPLTLSDDTPARFVIHPSPVVRGPVAPAEWAPPVVRSQPTDLGRMGRIRRG